MSSNVSVIGTGRMGSALATALFKNGFSTTVWNRTPEKTEPLARLGVRVSRRLAEAVKEADVVIVIVSSYTVAQQLLDEAEVAAALSGKVIVQLTTGRRKPGECAGPRRLHRGRSSGRGVHGVGKEPAARH